MIVNKNVCLEEAAAGTKKRPNRKEWRQRRQPLQPAGVSESEMVEKHVSLVKTIVGRIAVGLPSHVVIDDLLSAGLVGLLNAVRHFVPESGTAFETYARVRIRGAIFDELRNMDWVPRSVHRKARKVQYAMQEVEQEIGREATEEEMARAMQVSLGEYQRLLDEIRPAAFVSLDSVQNSDGEEGSCYYENVQDQSQEDPGDRTAKNEMTHLIVERIERLPEMQRKVLALYYFEGMRLREIAEAYGVTESRICQVHVQAILSIRACLKQIDIQSR
jgi:RNA polymerase sigma factor for flagellar operon FliA